MRWIKASERFPPFGKKVTVRRISNGKVWAAADNGNGTNVFRNYRAGDIEWQDEVVETEKSILEKCEAYIDNDPMHSSLSLFMEGFKLAGGIIK